MESRKINREDLLHEIEELNRRLEEANDTIEAIRTGQVDALVVQGDDGHQLFTLKSADQTYRVFIEKMTEGAVTLNHDGVIVYCNTAFARMVNFPLSNVLGKHFDDFIGEENRQQYQDLFDRCWNADVKGEVQLNGEGKTIPVQLSLTTLELDEGISLSIILTDLTSQKNTQLQLSEYNNQLQQINQELENSNNDLQQFASVASHDLQEPLRKIQIFSNMMHAEYGNELPKDSRKYLDKIIESAGRMKTLIIDILNYSKLSANVNSFDFIDLNTVLKDVLVDFDLIIQENSAIISVGYIPPLKVNKGQFRQVFQNIISNALKFVRPGESPIIEITSGRIAEKKVESPENPDGPYLLISIRDNGIGFDEKYAGNVFALFERLHSKDRYEGTGIGLAIAKKIVEKHNGIIQVRSQVGKGSEFMIILPMDPVNS